MRKLKEEFETLSFKTNVIDSLREEYIKALKDDNFKELINTLPMTEDELMKYTSKLEECSIEYAHCKKCKGLKECKNNVIGFCFTPYVSNQKLMFSYDICRYNEALRNKNRYQDNAFYFDIPKEIKEAKMSEIFNTDKKRTPIIAFLDELSKRVKKVLMEKVYTFMVTLVVVRPI